METAIKYIEDQLIHLENYVLRGEKENFIQYLKKWKDNKNISDLWRDAESFRFPLYFPDEFFETIVKLSEDNIKKLIEVLQLIDSPMVLHEVINISLHTRNNIYNSFELLKCAPLTVCTEKIPSGDKDFSKNGEVKYLFTNSINSIIAPVVLQILMWDSLQVDERDMTKTDDGEDLDDDICEDSNLLNRICDVLKNRKDGFYLAYHYMKYLLGNERKNSGYYDVLNSLADTFDESSSFIHNGRLEVEGLEKNIESCEEQFLTTGELYDLKIQEGDFSGDILTNYRTALWFTGIKKNEKELFESFKRVYSIQAMGFFTHDIKFYLKHFDIARVLLSQENPISAWKEVLDMSSASIQRISFQYFGDQGMHIRYHHAFMWSVGHRMLDVYCEHAQESKTKLESAREMWRTLWDEGINYIRRFSKYIDDSESNYIASLIFYYYCCFIKGTADNNIQKEGKEYDFSSLMQLFSDIKEFPVICMMSVMMLEKATLSCETLFDFDRKFFGDIFHKAQMISEGQISYRQIEGFLKKQRYVQIDN